MGKTTPRKYRWGRKLIYAILSWTRRVLVQTRVSAWQPLTTTLKSKFVPKMEFCDKNARENSAPHAWRYWRVRRRLTTNHGWVNPKKRNYGSDPPPPSPSLTSSTCFPRPSNVRPVHLTFPFLSLPVPQILLSCHSRAAATGLLFRSEKLCTKADLCLGFEKSNF